MRRIKSRRQHRRRRRRRQRRRRRRRKRRKKRHKRRHRSAKESDDGAGNATDVSNNDSATDTDNDDHDHGLKHLVVSIEKAAVQVVHSAVKTATQGFSSGAETARIFCNLAKVITHLCTCRCCGASFRASCCNGAKCCNALFRASFLPDLTCGGLVLFCCF